MASVILYKPNEQASLYPNATNIKVDNGVLTFYVPSSSFNNDAKIVTSVPFFIEEKSGM